jgi:hypothetical protein
MNRPSSSQQGDETKWYGNSQWWCTNELIDSEDEDSWWENWKDTVHLSSVNATSNVINQPSSSQQRDETKWYGNSQWWFTNDWYSGRVDWIASWTEEKSSWNADEAKWKPFCYWKEDGANWSSDRGDQRAIERKTWGRRHVSWSERKERNKLIRVKQNRRFTKQ